MLTAIFGASVLTMLPFARGAGCDANAWGYDEKGADWGDGSAFGAEWFCDGATNSPIDFDTSGFASSIDEGDLPAEMYLQPIEVTARASDYSVSNNGHSAVISPVADPDDDSPVSTFMGGFLGDAQATFAQFHFHWGKDNDTVMDPPNTVTGSEHRVDGMSYPLEMHFVYYLSDYDGLLDAINESLVAIDRGKTNYEARKLAVIGRFFEIGDETNEAFDDLVELLSDIQETGDEAENNGRFNILDFIEGIHDGDTPHDLADGDSETVTFYDYFSYMGGLTTPGCLEIVKWHVLVEPLVISQAQFDAFDALQDCHNHSMSGNWRGPVMNSNDVYSHCGVTEEGDRIISDSDYLCTEETLVMDDMETTPVSGAFHSTLSFAAFASIVILSFF